MNNKTAVAEQTRQKLKNAFLELYADKGMAEITVGAVTKKAGYNRSTFYNYYDTLQNLLNEIEDDVIEKIKQNSAAIDFDNIPNMNIVFSYMLNAFEQYGSTIYILLKNNSNTSFRRKIYETAKSNLRKTIKSEPNEEKDEKADYIFSFVSSSVLGLIEHWYSTDRKYTTEEFLRLVQQLVGNGVLSVMNNDGL